MLKVLRSICKAYTDNDRIVYLQLEPVVTEIGEQLCHPGGRKEMLRVFDLVTCAGGPVSSGLKTVGRVTFDPTDQGRIPGSRTLQMHWSGIGGWLG